MAPPGSGGIYRLSRIDDRRRNDHICYRTTRASAASQWVAREVTVLLQRYARYVWTHSCPYSCLHHASRRTLSGAGDPMKVLHVDLVLLHQRTQEVYVAHRLVAVRVLLRVHGAKVHALAAADQ